MTDWSTKGLNERTCEWAVGRTNEWAYVWTSQRTRQLTRQQTSRRTSQRTRQRTNPFFSKNMFNMPSLCFFTAYRFTWYSSRTRGTQTLPELVPRSDIRVPFVERRRYDVFPESQHKHIWAFLKIQTTCSFPLSSNLAFSKEYSSHHCCDRINIRYRCMYMHGRDGPRSVCVLELKHKRRTRAQFYFDRSRSAYNISFTGFTCLFLFFSVK